MKTTSHDSRPLLLTLLYPPSSPSSFFSCYKLRLPCPFICTNIKSSTTRSSSAMTTCHRNVVSLYTVKRPYEYVPSADKWNALYIISKYIKIKHKTICVREEKHMVKYKAYIYYIYTYLHGPRASLIGFKHAPEFSLQPAAYYIYISC